MPTAVVALEPAIVAVPVPVAAAVPVPAAETVVVSVPVVVVVVVPVPAAEVVGTTQHGQQLCINPYRRHGLGAPQVCMHCLYLESQEYQHLIH